MGDHTCAKHGLCAMFTPTGYATAPPGDGLESGVFVTRGWVCTECYPPSDPDTVLYGFEISEEEVMGEALQVGDLVGVKTGRGTTWEGRVEEQSFGKRAFLVRIESPGCTYRKECAPEEVHLLARGHGAPPGTQPFDDRVTDLGREAGHTVPYENCRVCHPKLGVQIAHCYGCGMEWDERAQKVTLEDHQVACPGRAPRSDSVTIAGVKITATATGAEVEAELQRLKSEIRGQTAHTIIVDEAAGWLPAGTLMPLSEPPKHSPAGYCEACAWSYCRVREEKPEPKVRCAGCDAPATDRTTSGSDPLAMAAAPSMFDGGAIFAFPWPPRHAIGEDPQKLCPPCAKKTAEFIAHLKATHGGRR